MADEPDLSGQTSSYLHFLPPVYRERIQNPIEGGSETSFLERFLLILEVIMGRAAKPEGQLDPLSPDLDEGPPMRTGLGELLDALPDLFHPQLELLFPDETDYMPPLLPPAAPGQPPPSQSQIDDYALDRLELLTRYVSAAPDPTDETWETTALSWLNAWLKWQSSWVALNLDDESNTDTIRNTLASAFTTFRQRGTAAGLENELQARTGLDIKVTNTAYAHAMVLGENTNLSDAFTAGDSVLDGARPFAFLVEVMVSSFNANDPDVRKAMMITSQLVSTMRPAHAQPVLRATPYKFILGVQSILAKSTLLPNSS